MALLDEVLGVGADVPVALGRPRLDLDVSVVRSLTEADLPALRAPMPVQAPAQTYGGLAKVRHSHHLLARLCAEGLHSDGEMGLISGYAPSYIAYLRKHDPAFRELLGYYSTQKEQIFVEVSERMKALGLSALDELQARLDSETDKWTKRELMELSELLLVKSQQRGGGLAPQGAGAGAGVTVNVKFVQAPQSGTTIDITPQGETDS
jgi:hypothetical protein